MGGVADTVAMHVKVAAAADEDADGVADWDQPHADDDAIVTSLAGATDDQGRLLG
jgi:hypothetical protein